MSEIENVKGMPGYYKKRYPLTFSNNILKNDDNLSGRYERAWVVARQAAALLKKNYGARKVVVFGSLIKASRFTKWSDIDLAAWGVPDNRFYAAVAAATGISSEFKIDLVDAKTAKSFLQKAIREGIEI